MTVLFFDYETTGVDPLKDRPVEVGIADQDGKVMLDTRCNPLMPIAVGASAVHGIHRKHITTFPTYLQVLKMQLEFFASFEDVIISGFNTSIFDIPMFEACIGSPVLLNYNKLDVLDVVYRYYPTIKDKKLTELYKRAFQEELIGAHGAIQDCIGTARLLEAFCENLGQTPMELALELSIPTAYTIMPVGKHRGKPIEDIPKGWARWMRDNAEGMRPDLRATVDTIVDF